MSLKLGVPKSTKVKLRVAVITAFPLQSEIPETVNVQLVLFTKVLFSDNVAQKLSLLFKAKDGEPMELLIE